MVVSWTKQLKLKNKYVMSFGLLILYKDLINTIKIAYIF